jgi:hypothetical protein
MRAEPIYDAVTDQLGRWNLNTDSLLRKCVERVLRSMEISSVYVLRTPKLQVAVVPKGMIWAHFTVHKRRWAVRHHAITLQRGAKALLILTENGPCGARLQKEICRDVAHHIGHLLCYLQRPGWIHECPDAERAARKCGLAKFLTESSR